MSARRLFDEIDSIDIPGLLSEMVSMPSYESEQRVVALIAQRLDKIGVKYELTDVAPSRQNLIASIGEGAKSLILNSHTDTVPPSPKNVAGRKYDPLKLTQEGDLLFGLGSCDAKGSLVPMLIAFETLARNVSLLKGKLILQAVCCEESGGRGTQTEVERGTRADAAIVGEPTDLVPMIGHKGGLGVDITVFGKAAHGSSPEEGINAIFKMARLVAALEELAGDIFTRRDPLLGHASLAVTKIRGGRVRNVIPDECAIAIDRRLLPGDTPEEALDEIIAVVDKQKAADSSLKVSVGRTIGIKACKISPDEPIVKVVKDSVAQVKGWEEEITGFSATCDMWSLVEVARIPTVILGPGKISVAHKADENIPANDLYEAAKIYATVALNFLNG